MKSRGVKIVKKPGIRHKWAFDVYDLETGEQLEDIYEVEFMVNREVSTIRITSGAPWVYEGEATFVTPEERAAFTPDDNRGPLPVRDDEEAS